MGFDVGNRLSARVTFYSFLLCKLFPHLLPFLNGAKKMLRNSAFKRPYKGNIMQRKCKHCKLVGQMGGKVAVDNEGF